MCRIPSHKDILKNCERHHLERRVVDMEAIVKICDSKEAMHEDHYVPMVGQHGDNGSNKMITTIFYLAKLFFDMRVRHHEMPQFISAIKTPSLW